MIGDVAIPTTLALLARTRDKLLSGAEAFAPLRVEGERARVEMLHVATESRSDEERLVARVTHLREMLIWIDELRPPDDAEQNRAWQTLLAARRLAHKILADQQQPQAGDRTRSSVDPEARRGKHGGWYDGYLLDLMVDAESELITAIDVLPANGDEAANAAALIRQEEAAQGNDVQGLSIDGVAFQGPVLRELEASEGLALDVYVPPSPESPTTHFRPQDFSEDPQQGTVTCPAGQTAARRERNAHDTGWKYRFAPRVCTDCPLRERCMAKPAATTGRTVINNEYEAEYQRMRAKSQTPQYAAVRREHPKVERKLSELVRRHGSRRARYRGAGKVLCQQLLAAVAANVKRIVQLLGVATSASRAC